MANGNWLKYYLHVPGCVQMSATWYEKLVPISCPKTEVHAVKLLPIVTLVLTCICPVSPKPEAWRTQWTLRTPPCPCVNDTPSKFMKRHRVEREKRRVPACVNECNSQSVFNQARVVEHFYFTRAGMMMTLAERCQVKRTTPMVPCANLNPCWWVVVAMCVCVCVCEHWTLCENEFDLWVRNKYHSEVS